MIGQAVWPYMLRCEIARKALRPLRKKRTAYCPLGGFMGIIICMSMYIVCYRGLMDWYCSSSIVVAVLAPCFGEFFNVPRLTQTKVQGGQMVARTVVWDVQILRFSETIAHIWPFGKVAQERFEWDFWIFARIGRLFLHQAKFRAGRSKLHGPPIKFRTACSQLCCARMPLGKVLLETGVGAAK